MVIGACPSPSPGVGLTVYANGRIALLFYQLARPPANKVGSTVGRRSIRTWVLESLVGPTSTKELRCRRGLDQFSTLDPEQEQRKLVRAPLGPYRNFYTGCIVSLNSNPRSEFKNCFFLFLTSKNIFCVDFLGYETCYKKLQLVLQFRPELKIQHGEKQIVSRNILILADNIFAI